MNKILSWDEFRPFSFGYDPNLDFVYFIIFKSTKHPYFYPFTADKDNFLEMLDFEDDLFNFEDDVIL